MENKKNNGLIILFVIVLVIAILGIAGTFYFYNKTLSKDNNETNNVIDSNEINENNDKNISKNQVVEPEKLVFTSVTKYDFMPDEEKDYTFSNGKMLKFKYLSDGANSKMYFNEKIVTDSYRTVYITDYIVLFATSGQYGSLFEIYDLNANLLDKKTFENSSLLFTNLRVENGKLIADFVDSSLIADGGFIIEKTYIYQCGYFEITEDTRPNFNINEYTDLINRHENDVLNGIYEIKYVDNKIKYELLSAKETVKTFLEKNSGSLCVRKEN